MLWEDVIRQRFDVQAQSGDEFICRCPWHNDQGKPNLYVNGKKGVWLCHSCGSKGHLRSITQSMPAVKTDGVRKALLEQMSTSSNERPLYKAEGWLKKFDFPHDQWDERLSPACQERFQVGYDPFTDLLTIPIRDSRGRLLGVITRRLDDLKPKYRYPKGVKIGTLLFASWLIRKRHRKVAIVEGSVDTMACWDARVPALGLLGSRMTEDQRDLLLRLGVQHVVLMLDNDNAGRAGQQQVNEMLQGTGILVSVGVYRSYWGDKDPSALNADRRRKMFHSARLWRDTPSVLANPQ